MTEDFDSEKSRAAAWFRELRDQIVTAFEALETGHTAGPLSDTTPGRFEVTETRRTSDDGSDAGGGLMSVLRGGRVRGVLVVTVSFGALEQNWRGTLPAVFFTIETGEVLVTNRSEMLNWTKAAGGVMTAPDGTRYAIVVLLGDTTASVPARMELMQAVSGAVAEFHGK